jgi:hypothetical protein
MASTARSALRAVLRAATASAAPSAATPRAGALCGVRFSSGGGGGGGAPPPAEGGDAVERLVAAISRSPQMQQMLMMALPPAMRRPEVLQQMLAHPEARAKVAEMLRAQGLVAPEMAAGLDEGRLEAAFAHSAAAGLDPAALFSRLTSYPGLLQRMQNPRILRAVMVRRRRRARASCRRRSAGDPPAHSALAAHAACGAPRRDALPLAAHALRADCTLPTLPLSMNHTRWRRRGRRRTSPATPTRWRAIGTMAR